MARSSGTTRASLPTCSRRSHRLDPRSIALNYSTSDPAADGLTHGLWLLLQETLAGTPYADRLVSSEAIVNALRGRKSPEEVRRIRAAVADTEEIFERVHRLIAAGPVRAGDRRGHARRGGEARPWLRLGRGPLSGRERRPRQGRRALVAERAPARARPAPARRLRRLSGTTTARTCSASGTSPTATGYRRRSSPHGRRSGRPSTPASPS